MFNSLFGVNAALLILAGGFVFFVLRYQYSTWNEKVDKSTDLYKTSVVVGAVAIFIQALLFFIFDFDLITFGQSRQIGLIPKILFAVQLAIAYKALGWPLGKFLVPAAILFGVIVYVASVLS